MKLAKYIYKNGVPYSLDFSDTFYHDGAKALERLGVYVQPAFKQTLHFNEPKCSKLKLNLCEHSFKSKLYLSAKKAQIADQISRLQSSNFNAYLKNAPDEAEPANAFDDDIANAETALKQIGALEAFNEIYQTPPPLKAAKISLKILEIGFGFGANFALSYQLAAAQKRKIYYAAVESHYVDAKAICAQAITLGAPLPKEFSDQFPPRAHGVYRIELEWAILDLYFGDARNILPSISNSFEAIYFDIFAHQNELYNALLPQCARLCSGQIFSFLANSEFKKSLKAAGFKPHFVSAAHKREVCASYGAAAPKEWLNAKSAVIIGAGIAGLLSAYELTKAGVKTTILEANSPASAGSGNILGQISHVCHSPASALGRFQYYGAVASYRAFKRFLICYGALELPISDEAARRIKAMKYPLARHIKNGAFLLAGGTLSPKFCCKMLARNLDIRKEFATQISSDESSVQVLCKSGAVFNADAVVLATGCGTIGALNAPLSAVRGQVCWIASTQRRGVSERAYITANCGGVAVLGATYERFSAAASGGSNSNGGGAASGSNSNGGGAASGGLSGASDISDRSSLATLRWMEADMLLSTAGLSRANLLAMKNGWRCYSGDRFALIGSLAPQERLAALFKKGVSVQINSRVFINAAHGSRGLSTAILGARILAEQIAGVPSGVNEDIARECDPNRFELRRLRKASNCGDEASGGF